MILPRILRPTLEPRAITGTLRATPPVSPPPGPWALDLDFRRDELDPRLIVTAPGPKTYWDESSILRVAPPGTWPIEWDPVTRERRGRSVWEARTNAVTYNRNLGARIGNLVDFVASSAGRWRMREMTSEGAHYLPQSFNVTAGQWVSVSAITARAADGGVRHPVLVFTGTAMAANYGVQLNLDTGQLSYSSSAAAAALRVATLQLLDGTWVFSASAQASNTGGFSIQYRIGNTPAISFAAYAGDGVSGVDWDWLQAEISERPGPFIPTEAAAVTRPAEVISFPVTDDWHNPMEGVWVIDYDGAATSGVRTIFQIDPGGQFSQLLLRWTGAGRLACAAFRDNAVIGQVFLDGQISRGGRTRVAIHHKFNMLAASANGGQPLQVALTEPMFWPMSRVRIGSDARGLEQSCAWHQRLRYARAMPAGSTVQSLSAL